jgi:tRNA-splicing endonuclease subunit Sen54
MADVDEDVVQTPATGQVEVDLSDETQDFRFLNHLNLYVPELA